MLLVCFPNKVKFVTNENLLMFSYGILLLAIEMNTHFSNSFIKSRKFQFYHFYNMSFLSIWTIGSQKRITLSWTYHNPRKNTDFFSLQKSYAYSQCLHTSSVCNDKSTYMNFDLAVCGSHVPLVEWTVLKPAENCCCLIRRGIIICYVTIELSH